jgi:hypothetical protein
MTVMADKTKLPKQIREIFAAYGREGGKARSKKLTPEQRKRIAKKAAETRWKKGVSDGRHS